MVLEIVEASGACSTHGYGSARGSGCIRVWIFESCLHVAVPALRRGEVVRQHGQHNLGERGTKRAEYDEVSAQQSVHKQFQKVFSSAGAHVWRFYFGIVLHGLSPVCVESACFPPNCCVFARHVLCYRKQLRWTAQWTQPCAVRHLCRSCTRLPWAQCALLATPHSDHCSP